MSRVALGVSAGALVAGGVAVAVLVGSGGSSSRASTGGKGTGHAATVTRRNLVSTDQEDGTLGYADPRPAIGHQTGTVTWLPAEGATIRRGQTLYRVDGSPVTLFYGSTPAYRALSAGVTDGADVRELERNLKALGYDPGTVDDHFDASTTTAVEAWQKAHGLTQTGTVDLGRVIFLPGARRVGTINLTLGESATQSGSGSGSGASGASWSGGTVHTSFAVWDSTCPPGTDTTPTTPTTTPSTPTTPTTPTTTTPSDTCPTPAAPKKKKPAKKKAAATPKRSASGSPGRSSAGAGPSSAGGGSGSAGGSGGRGGGSAPTAAASSNGASSGSGSSSSSSGSTGAVDAMETTSTRRLVTVQLDAAKQTLAVRGAAVQVGLPDGSTAGGHISAVGRVAQSSRSSSDQTGGTGSGGSGSGSGSATSTIEVDIALDRARDVPRLDQAPVTVDFAQETRQHVLAVPVTALIAVPGGGYAVDVVQAGGGTRRVAVSPGLFADSYVEIAGSSLQEGDRVEVPSS